MLGTTLLVTSPTSLTCDQYIRHQHRCSRETQLPKWIFQSLVTNFGLILVISFCRHGGEIHFRFDPSRADLNRFFTTLKMVMIALDLECDHAIDRK